jgi:hypothetical protein
VDCLGAIHGLVLRFNLLDVTAFTLSGWAQGNMETWFAFALFWS